MTGYATEHLASERIREWQQEAGRDRLVRAAGAEPNRRHQWRVALTIGAVRRLVHAAEST